MLVAGHEECFVCHNNFCFSSINSCDLGVETKMVFSLDHEGWMGIPHGGVAMTALLDLADHCWLQNKGENLVYPLEIDWRFADAVRIGDEMSLKVVFNDENNILLSMQRQGSEKIYLKGEVKVAAKVAEVNFPLLEPELLQKMSSQHQPLAIYDNCFVCGRKRKKPGLQRRFFKFAGAGDESFAIDEAAIIVRFGGGHEGAQLASSFQQASGTLHPGVLAALLDELCGWSGVLADDLYGYTVRFKLHINRLPAIGEELFGMAPTPLVRGRGSRKFYHPQGALYQKKADGSLEIIAVATGQWLARDELRQQFDDTQIVEDMSGIVF